jgi:hypothetical protein
MGDTYRFLKQSLRILFGLFFTVLMRLMSRRCLFPIEVPFITLSIPSRLLLLYLLGGIQIRDITLVFRVKILDSFFPEIRVK